jgi:hypothetical protein
MLYSIHFFEDDLKKRDVYIFRLIDDGMLFKSDAVTTSLFFGELHYSYLTYLKKITVRTDNIVWDVKFG